VQKELEPYLLRTLVADEEPRPQPLSPDAAAVPAPAGLAEEPSLPDFNKAVEDALSKLFA
jgi:hypothetical protein